MAKIWFITGASRGLGLAIAQAALEAGSSVIATARKPEQLNHLVEKFGTDRVLPLRLDVAHNDEVIRAVKAGHEKFGRIDVVVNNAGYANLASIEDIAMDDFEAQVATNFFGVVYVTKAMIPILREQGSGHIFQISSIGGRVATPGLAAYQSSKWAIGGFSTSLSQEVGPFGIKVTVIEPGGIRTDWAGSSMNIPDMSEPYKPIIGPFAEMHRAHSGKEVSLPSKIAGIIVKLAGDKDAPLRLLCGPDAVQYAEKAAEALAASDKKWRDVSCSCT
jgi:NAD(P)-dependent dehydrogenase (short-subunit alcohol dehydrogenase family)